MIYVRVNLFGREFFSIDLGKDSDNFVVYGTPPYYNSFLFLSDEDTEEISSGSDSSANKKKGKHCGRCGEYKNEDEFYKSKTGKMGLHSYCKDCNKRTARRWHKKNKKKRRAKEARKKVKSKVCSGCLTLKSSSEFYDDNKAPDGLRYTCIECDKEYKEKKDKNKN